MLLVLVDVYISITKTYTKKILFHNLPVFSMPRTSFFVCVCVSSVSFSFPSKKNTQNLSWTPIPFGHLNPGIAKVQGAFAKKYFPPTLAPRLEVATQGIELGDEPRSQVQVGKWVADACG